MAPKLPSNIPNLHEITLILRGYRSRRLLADNLMRRAAVATVLREPSLEEGPELLLIRRAEQPSDPWSGHMAFPGGRVEPEDPDEYAAALRETWEEVGLDLLARGSLIGRLSPVLAKAHGKPLPLSVSPFVFSLAGEPAFTLNHEVQEVVWVPLRFLADEQNRQTMERSFAGVSFELPCYEYQGRRIWGLTLQMLDELLTCLAEYQTERG